MSIANLFSQVSPENRYYSYDREIMEDYDNRINIYNDALNKYKTEASDYQSLADAHNTRINDYNDSLTAYREQADAYNSAINRFNEGPRTTPYADVDYYVASPGEFLSTAPVFEGGARPVAPEDPGFSGADVDEFVEQAGKRATDRGKANAAALNVFAQSGNYATAPMIPEGAANFALSGGAGVGTVPQFSFSSNSFAEGGVVPGIPGLTDIAVNMTRGPRGIAFYMEEGGLVLGEKTGETTTAGRDVYVAPNGDQMSEKSMTFEIDGLFVNIPSIHNGTLYSSEKIYEMFMNGEIQPTSAHRTEEEAISAAQQRSDTLLP
jgi:hypothetical protein